LKAGDVGDQRLDVLIRGRAQQAKAQRSRNGSFVAINFCDPLYLHRLAAIFEFEVVAITRHGGQDFFFASEESLREYYPKPYTILNGLHALHKGKRAPKCGAR
jgi:hypothetical protein